MQDKTTICPICESEFIKTRNRVYCSPECNAEANRRRAKQRYHNKMKNCCLWCGKSSRLAFCSDKCKTEYSTQRELDHLIRSTDDANRYICKKTHSCRYGLENICGYILFTGHSRPCYPSECVYYERKER